MSKGEKESGEKTILKAIETKSLHKQYGEISAVSDLNLDISEGEIFTLLGPNGSGKTTTIKMLTTLQKPSSGTATIFEKSIDREADIRLIREMIAIIPQSNALDPLLSVWDNLRFYSKLQNLRTDCWKTSAMDYLSRLDLKDKINAPIMALSGGQYRRVQVCRALLAKKQLLFLDEPTLGIDVDGKIKVWDLIKQYLIENKCAILLSTNDMTEAEYLSDRIAFLYKGSIRKTGTTDDLKKNADRGVVQIKFDQAITGKIKTENKFKIKSMDEKTLLIYMDSMDSDLRPLLAFAAQIGAIQDINLQKANLTETFKQIYSGQ